MFHYKPSRGLERFPWISYNINYRIYGQISAIMVNFLTVSDLFFRRNPILKQNGPSTVPSRFLMDKTVDHISDLHCKTSLSTWAKKLSSTTSLHSAQLLVLALHQLFDHNRFPGGSGFTVISIAVHLHCGLFSLFPVKVKEHCEND